MDDTEVFLIQELRHQRKLAGWHLKMLAFLAFAGIIPLIQGHVLLAFLLLLFLAAAIQVCIRIELAFEDDLIALEMMRQELVEMDAKNLAWLIKVAMDVERERERHDKLLLPSSG